MLSRRLIAFLPVLPLACVAAWVFGFSSLMARADFASMGARYKLDSWLAGRQQWTVPEWLEVRASLEAALRITPDNPMLQDYMGSLYAFRGYEARRNAVLRKAFYTEALPYQRQSLALRPHNAGAWINYARSLQAMSERDEEILYAERRAFELGRYEAFVRRGIQNMVFVSWDRQPTDIRNWAVQAYCSLPLEEKKNIQIQLNRDDSGSRDLSGRC